MTKKQILMNKPVNLGLSMLKLSKIIMYKFWYDYVKVNYALSSNDDKRMQSIHLIETYVYRTSNNIIKRYKK